MYVKGFDMKKIYIFVIGLSVGISMTFSFVSYIETKNVNVCQTIEKIEPRMTPGNPPEIKDNRRSL